LSLFDGSHHEKCWIYFEWSIEWKQIVDQAKPTIYARQQQSLEEYHKVFVLANILRRPIIVYGPSKTRSFKPGGTAVIINMQGIYLPLLWDPNLCHRQPLCLGFYEGHFIALVPVAYSDNQFVMPLEDCHGNALSVHFLLQNEVSNAFYLLQRYLNVSAIFCSSIDKNLNIVRLVTTQAPHERKLIRNFIMKYLDKCSDKIGRYPLITSLCRNEMCSKLAEIFHDGYCMQCYRTIANY